MSTISAPIRSSESSTSSEDGIAIDASFISPIGARTKKHTNTRADVGTIESAAHAMLARLYDKYAATNEMLTGRIEASRPTPPSPGLSPIHITSMAHSPILDEKEANKENANANGKNSFSNETKSPLFSTPADHSCAHSEVCDHSIHSIRPSNYQSHSHGRPSSSTTTRSPTFAKSAGTQLRTVVGRIGQTRPTDLYQHAAERATFFKLIQQLWDQQVDAYEQQRRASEKKQQKAAQSRSTMTTITSTPGSSTNTSAVSTASSVASSLQSTSDESSHSHSGSSPSLKSDPSPLLLWEKQVIAWENRLCAWKNAQEETLFARARELEQARLSMERAMNEQEELYKQRSARFVTAAEKLEKDRKEFKDEVRRNGEREAQLQALLHEREKELSRKEVRLAKQKREFEESLMKAASNAATATRDDAKHLSHSVNIEQRLHALTNTLTAAFEEKEKTLSDLYATKMNKVSDELVDLRNKSKDLQLKERKLEEERVKLNDTHRERMKSLEERESRSSQDHSSSLDLQRQLDLAREEHVASLKSIEQKWHQRAEGWFAQRDALQSELESLRAAANTRESVAIEEVKESTKLQKTIDKLQARVRNADEALNQARVRIGELEDIVESKKDSDLLLQLAESKASKLESHLNQVRAQVSQTTLQGHATALQALTTQFEQELASQKVQYEAELKELMEGHTEQVKEFEEALKSSQRELQSSQQTIRDQNSVIDELRDAIAREQQHLSEVEHRLQEAIAAGSRRPPSAEIGTDCAELVAAHDAALEVELATARVTIQQKAAIVEAMNEQLAATEKAFNQLQTQLNELKQEAKETTANELTQLKADHADELKRLIAEHESSMASLRESYDADLSSCRSLLASRAAELASLGDENSELVRNIARREEVVRRQVELIEGSQVARVAELARRENDLNQRAEELHQRVEELDQRQKHFDDAKELADETFIKRQLDLESRITSQERESLELASLKSQLDDRALELDSLRRELDSNESRHAREVEEFRHSLEALEASRTRLNAELSTLESDRTTMQRQAEELKLMKDEVEEWKQHVQKRDQELTEAIAKVRSIEEKGETQWRQLLSMRVIHRFFFFELLFCSCSFFLSV